MIYQIFCQELPVGNLISVQLPEFEGPWWYVAFTKHPRKLTQTFEEAVKYCQDVLGKGQGRIVATCERNPEQARRQSELIALGQVIETMIRKEVKPDGTQKAVSGTLRANASQAVRTAQEAEKRDCRQSSPRQ